MLNAIMLRVVLGDITLSVICDVL